MEVAFSIDQTKCGITTIVVIFYRSNKVWYYYDCSAKKAVVQHLIRSRSLGKEKKIYGEHSQISKYR